MPTFNDELRTHKPILLYWLTMVSYRTFGINEFGARFASSALALGTTLLTYLIGRRLFSPEVGLWGGIILASTLMFNVAARAATPDSTLIFCGTLAICLYVYSIPIKAWQNHHGQQDRSVFDFHSIGWTLGIYGAMGLGILAKGPIGIVLPTAVLGMFLLIARQPSARRNSSMPTTRLDVWIQRLRTCLSPFTPRHFWQTCWKMRPLTAIMVAAIVAVPWYLAVGIETNGAWLRGFFFEHNLGRAMDSREGHQGSIFFYPIALLVGFFPWSVFALPVTLWVRQAIRTPANRQSFTLLVCWVGVYLTAFTVAQTKLPSYITPTYPAVALLVGSFISAYVRRLSDQSLATWWPAVAASCLVVVGISLLFALPIAAHQYLPGDEWLGVVGGIPLLGGLISLIAMRQAQRSIAMTAFATAAIAFVITLFAFVAPRVSRHQQIDQLLAFIDHSTSPQIATYATHEPSWVFYAGQTVPFFRSDDSQQVQNYLAEKPHHYLITTRDRYEELRPQLTQRIKVLGEIPYFLREQNLLLLGRPAPTAKRLENLIR
ncbi:MAG: glycosyltransferase family 39 protein [Pirellulaceae bacterium]|nr:glycosyltransferase family 39 protein [Pirellulaceae bacterium]